MSNFFNVFKGEENKDNLKETIEALDLGLIIKRPTNYGKETIEITELIKNGKIVAFTLENLSSEEAIRTFDYITGATNILGGKVEKVTDKVYISVPFGIKVEESYLHNNKDEE